MTLICGANVDVDPLRERMERSKVGSSSTALHSAGPMFPPAFAIVSSVVARGLTRNHPCNDNVFD